MFQAIHHVAAILFLIAGFVESIKVESDSMLALQYFQMSLLIQLMERVEDVRNKIKQKE